MEQELSLYINLGVLQEQKEITMPDKIPIISPTRNERFKTLDSFITWFRGDTLRKFVTEEEMYAYIIHHYIITITKILNSESNVPSTHDLYIIKYISANLNIIIGGRKILEVYKNRKG